MSIIKVPPKYKTWGHFLVRNGKTTCLCKRIFKRSSCTFIIQWRKERHHNLLKDCEIIFAFTGLCERSPDEIHLKDLRSVPVSSDFEIG